MKNNRLSTKKSAHALIVRYLSLSMTVLFVVGCNDPYKFKQLESIAKQETPLPVADPVVEPVPTPIATPVPEPTPIATPVPTPIATPVPTPISGKLESFTQTGNNKIDILVVKDVSQSMEKEQKKLGQRLASFISSLNGRDYQIAVTTTDLSGEGYRTDGKIINLYKSKDKVIHPRTQKAEDLFYNTMTYDHVDCRQITCKQSATEEPLRATLMAIDKKDKENKGFFRADADLAVVVLSDEDEMSDRKNKKATKPQQVLDAVKKAYPNKKFSYYGIVVIPGDEVCLEDQNDQSFGNNSYYATAVAELAKLTGGELGSICDADYSHSLRKISEKMNSILDSVQLAQIPKAGSVQVTFTPVENAVGFKVEANKIIFDRTPILGTKIDVTYEPESIAKFLNN